MTTTKSYDSLNRLTRIASVPSASSVVSFDYVYNQANQRIRATQADGSYWLYEFDGLGQVKSGRKYWADGTPVAGQQFEYGFDDIGNRTSTKAGGDQGGANLRSASYTPNSLNQYSSRTVPGAVDIMGIALATNAVTVNSQATYRKGEYFRKELSVVNSSVPVWQSITVTAPNETTVAGNAFVPKTPEPFGYDLDGNLTSDGRWTYTWDAENRLMAVVASTAVGPQQLLRFEYDSRSRRIHKQVWPNTGGTGNPTNDLRFVYDGWNLVATLNPQLSALNSFLWGLDLSGSLQGAGGVGGLLAVKDAVNGVHFAMFDGNGNVAALLNAPAATLSAVYEYGPFGELIRSTGLMAEANPVRFSTKYQDSESDFLYYGHRFLATSVGRWLSRDPIGERGGRNIYAFVLNNPPNLVDYLGLEASEKPCCDNPCSEEGATKLTGEYASLLLAAEQPIDGPNVIDETSKKIKKVLWVCKKQGGYVAPVGGIVLALGTKTAKDLDEYQNGIKLYTVLAYRICMKGNCGGARGMIKQLRRTCSPLHWTPANTEPRQCKPSGAEAHPLNPSAFVNRTTAEAAAPRCQKEHVDEFEHPEKYIKW